MNSFFKIFIAAAMVVGISFEASAKDKKKPKGPNKGQECHWLNPPETEICEKKNFAKGFVQCGAFVVVGYCEADRATDVAHCLDDNRGKTKDCFEESSATFSKRLRNIERKKGRRVVPDPRCGWSESSFEFGVNNFTANCGGADYEYRRAECTVDGKEYSPFLFCRLARASHDPRTCMKDEENKSTLDCRRRFLGARSAANIDPEQNKQSSPTAR